MNVPGGFLPNHASDNNPKFRDKAKKHDSDNEEKFIRFKKNYLVDTPSNLVQRIY